MACSTPAQNLLIFLFCFTFGVLSSEDGGEEADVGPYNNQVDTDVPVEDGVLILTDDNFDNVVSPKDAILVEFYAPWCGHCKSLAPEYSKAAGILRSATPPVPLAKVDATKETDLATRFQVTGYPTLFIFRKGKEYPYEGPRTATGIVEYMLQQADPNWKPPPEVVLTLTGDNFTQTVSEADIILVEFYAPWCGHCKQLAPEYERAARALKDHAIPIPLAKIDGTKEKDLAEQYGASGWPTLLIFRLGRKYSYTGPRDEAGIVRYMKEQATFPSIEADSVKSLINGLNKLEPTVVGFFKSKKRLYEEFIAAAYQERNRYTFLHTFDHTVAAEANISPDEVVVYPAEIFGSNYEPSRVELKNKDSTMEKILEFIENNSVSLVGHRRQDNLHRYHSRYPLVVVYYDVNFSFDYRVQTQLIRKEVLKVAKDYIGKVTFAISSEEEFEDELKDLNLDDSGEDVNAGYFATAKTRYRMEPVEDFNAKKLRKFVQNVEAGKVAKRIKSQPVPNEKGPVTAIVGSTFDKLVTRSEKDVLLEFYAPWCGHCQKLEPIYKKLAKQLAQHKMLTVAKIDATANDYPDSYQVDGFPSLFYIPASNKNVIKYDGERSLQSLEDFVKKQLGAASAPKDEL